MPNLGITNLTAGEVSPTLLGRADTQKFANACERLENFLITVTGMWSYRPGMGLMGLPKSQANSCILRPFQFSDQQGYMLELGDLYMRLWYTTGQIVDPDTNQPIEVVTPFPLADLSLLGFAQSADYLFVVDENVGITTIKRLSHTRWDVSSWLLKDGPYGNENADTGQTLSFSALDGNCTVTAAGFAPDRGGGTPFLAGDEGRLIRIADGTDGDGNPIWRWLIITAITSATVVSATWQNGPATTFAANAPQWDWRLGIYSDRLGWPAACRIFQQRLVLAGAQSAPDRIDGSAIAGYDTFAPTDPLVDDGAFGYALGTENANRVVGLGISNDLLVLTQGAEHRFNGSSAGDAVTPSQVWTTPIAPDGAAREEPVQALTAVGFIDKYRLNVRAVAFDWRIQNYAPENLTLLADHMCWLDPASPGFRDLRWQGNPLGTLWVRRGNNELAGAIYDPSQSVLGWHRHPMGAATDEAPQVESIAILKGPTYDELWAVVRRDLVLEAGNRTLRTIERMGRPGLWETPYASQSFLDSSLQLRNAPTADLVPGATSGDAVVFSLQNVAAGFAFTEAMEGQYLKYRYNAGKNVHGRIVWKTAIAGIDAVTDATHATCSIVRDFPSTSPIAAGNWGLTTSRVTGLDHLEGCLVTAVSDGQVCDPALVTEGVLQLEVPGWEVSAGLPYEGWMVSMPLDPGPQPAVGQMRPGRTEDIKVRLLNSLGGEFASVPETDEEECRFDELVPYTEGQGAPLEPPKPFTGDKQIKTAGEWTWRNQIAIRQTEPLPLNMQLLIPHAYAPHIQP